MRRALLLAPLALALAVPAAADFTDAGASPATEAIDSLGSAWVDFDRDGDLDLLRTNWSGNNRLLRNDGGGTFVDVANANLRWQAATNKAGCAWADFDRDGLLDVAINTASGVARILRQETAGNFVSLGDLTGVGDGRTASFVDFDSDGDLDLYLTGTSVSVPYRNDGGSWAPLTFGVPAQGTTWADYNRDGRPDFMTSYSAHTLRRNDGGGSFASVGGAAFDSTGGSLAAIFADLDDDGDLDIVRATQEFSRPNALFRNDGGDVFTNVTASAGDFGAPNRVFNCVDVADIDLDGDQDVFFGEDGGGPGLLLRNDGGLSFTDVTATTPLSAGFLQYAGMFGDYDLDGDPDLHISNWGSTAAQLLRNDQQTGNHWLRVILLGATDTAGTGSWIEVTANGKTQTRYVGAGQSWCVQSVAPFHTFGLGPATTASVTVHWPSGQVSTVENARGDRALEIREPGGEVVTTSPYVPAQTFEFALAQNDATVENARLFLRRSGTGDSFSEIPMTFVGGTGVWQAAVASGFATKNGVEYFIEYRRNGGGSPIRAPYAGSETSPGFVPALLANEALPGAPAPEQYAMLGLPFEAVNGDAGSAFGDELGPYDPKRWRLASFDPTVGSNGAYREYPGAPPLAPGQGFWLVMREPALVGTQGTSTPTPGGFAIQLQRGWNQIAHPYLFPVALSDVDFSAAPDVEQELHEWDGTQYVTEGELEPWEGYFVFNAAAAAQTVVIPGVESSGAGSSAPPARSPQSAPDGWRLAVHAAGGGVVDRDNVIGVAAGATDDPDRLDRHAPPAPPEAMRAYFEQISSAGELHELNRDLRRSADATWELVVEAPGEGSVQVEFDGVRELPLDLEAVAIVEDTFAVIDLRERDVLTLPGGRTHRMRIVVGSSGWIEQVRDGRQSPVAEFQLGLGYPNPFASSTRIAWIMPSEAPVELVVYDVSGRRVRSLAEGRRPAGRHSAEWDGGDERGRPVAPGVYFVRMRAGGQEQTRKLVLRR